MSNLEITRLCALAMGYQWIDGMAWDSMRFGPGKYDPLHDDAQAMELVKRFRLLCDPHTGNDEWKVWCATARTKRMDYIQPVFALDLNRAICECVAKMQEGRYAPSLQSPATG